MPTNQQRRDAAKRKLERQLARREAAERARKQRLVIIGVVAAVLVISGGVWLFVSRGSSSSASGTSSSTGSTTSTAPSTPCSYPAGGTAAKPVTPPTNLSPMNSGTVQATIVMNGQNVPVTLDRSLAPCGVNAFLSLASQGFYDSTDCYRLTASEQLNILQCGDPSGKGNGGPGFSFATEVASTATYPVGTLALANSGGDTNGSQFFIVYGTTTIDPTFTILGTVSSDGMAVINGIAAQGVQKGAQDGPPVHAASIGQVTVPSDALEGSGTYTTSSAAPAATGPSAAGSAETGAATSGTEAPSTQAPSTEAPSTEAPAGTTSGGAG